MLFIHTSQPKENKPENNEEEIHELRFQILLMEHHSTKEKTDNNTCPTYHTNNGNHCPVDAQRIEIHEIGNRQEYTYEDD